MAENLATEMAAWRIETSLLPLRDGHYRSPAKGQVITRRTEQEDPSKLYQTLLLGCSLSISLTFNLLAACVHCSQPCEEDASFFSTLYKI